MKNDFIHLSGTPNELERRGSVLNCMVSHSPEGLNIFQNMIVAVGAKIFKKEISKRGDMIAL